MNSNNNISRAKSRVLVFLLGIFLGVSPLSAQVFVVNGEEDLRDGSTMAPPGMPNGHGQGWDDYAPLGYGSALLIAFGAAYLLVRRKKGDWED